ncbi:hypothetical protein AA313_de0202390 [Arthrobotrys entomopaga]|nr:hypothetical protein AA313_de0202390 [Arthrobotrys entomopaga]
MKSSSTIKDTPEESVSRVYFPAELWLTIYEHLPCRELKAISYCSKRHRAWAIPHLYWNIKLSKESIAAFDGGKFTDLKNHVTDITFDKLVFPTGAYTGTLVKLLRKYCDALRLFPNIQGIRVVFSTTKWFEWPIPTVLWFRLSEYPWFANLKRFSLEPILFSEGSPEWVSELTAIESCTPKDLEFLKVAKVRRRVKGEYYDLRYLLRSPSIPFPPNLEEITTRMFGWPWVGIPLGLHAFDPRNQGVSDPFVFFRKSIDTLKRVKLHCPWLSGGYLCSCQEFVTRFVTGPCPVAPYTSVDEFWLVLDNGNPSDAVGFTRRVFPNVRKLRIDTTGTIELGEGVYGHMAHLERLEQARIVWPNVRYKEHHIRRAAPSDLRELVNSWAPGLPHLEFVEFADGYEPAEDDYYYRHKDTIPTGRNVEVCRIFPGQERRYFKREKGNRHGKDRFMDRGEESSEKREHKGKAKERTKRGRGLGSR